MDDPPAPASMGALPEQTLPASRATLPPEPAVALLVCPPPPPFLLAPPVAVERPPVPPRPEVLLLAPPAPPRSTGESLDPSVAAPPAPPMGASAAPSLPAPPTSGVWMPKQFRLGIRVRIHCKLPSLSLSPGNQIVLGRTQCRPAPGQRPSRARTTETSRFWML